MSTPCDKVLPKLTLCGKCNGNGSSGDGADGCSCCVKPMEQFLLAFKSIIADAPAAQKQFGISTDTQNQVTAISIEDVLNSILTSKRENNNTLIVPVCQIVGIQSGLVDQVSLTPPSSIKPGFCSCCESPLRKQLSDLKTAGTSINVATFGSGNFTNIENVTVTDVGEGMAIFYKNATTKYALSICKIAYIEIL